MNNNKQKYVVSLDTLKIRNLVRKVVTDVTEKTGYTGELYEEDKIEMISVLPFHDGICSVMITTGPRSSIDIWLPSNSNEASDRNMRIRFSLYSKDWNDLINEELFYDYDEFMDNYLYPYKSIEKEEKED